MGFGLALFVPLWYVGSSEKVQLNSMPDRILLFSGLYVSCILSLSIGCTVKLLFGCGLVGVLNSFVVSLLHTLLGWFVVLVRMLNVYVLL